MFNVACNIDSISSDWSRGGLPPLSHYVTAPLRQGRSLGCAAWVAVSDCCQCSMFNVQCLMLLVTSVP